MGSDFAGCVQTRKSTSGGCIFRGRHLLTHWSSTRRIIALSSGEAELSGILKGASEGLSMQSVLRYLGIETAISIRADASAAIGICKRHGLGQLWVQQRLRQGDIRLYKHPGSESSADVLTKHIASEPLLRHVSATGLQFRQPQEGGAACHVGKFYDWSQDVHEFSRWMQERNI